jgi:hypothetical protein
MSFLGVLECDGNERLVMDLPVDFVVRWCRRRSRAVAGPIEPPHRPHPPPATHKGQRALVVDTQNRGPSLHLKQSPSGECDTTMKQQPNL